MKTFISNIILGLDNPDGIAEVKFITDDFNDLATIPITIPNIKALSVADIETLAIRKALEVMKEITET